MLVPFLAIILAVLFAACTLFVAACLAFFWLMGFSFTWLLTRSESVPRNRAESLLAYSLPVLPVVATMLGAFGALGIAMRAMIF